MDQVVRCEEDQMARRLNEASMEGSVDRLNSLLQNDPLILSKISLASFGETPLHKSAMIGHLSFTQELLSVKC